MYWLLVQQARLLLCCRHGCYCAAVMPAFVLLQSYPPPGRVATANRSIHSSCVPSKPADSANPLPCLLLVRVSSPCRAVLCAVPCAVQGAVGRNAAQQCYLEALRQDVLYAPAWRGLGDLLREGGESVQALSCYQEAVRLRPCYADAFTGMGVVLKVRGPCRALCCAVCCAELCSK